MPATRHARSALRGAAALIALAAAINCSGGGGATLPDVPAGDGPRSPSEAAPGRPGPESSEVGSLSDEVLATLEPDRLVAMAKKTPSEDDRIRFLEAAVAQAADDPKILRCLIVAHEVRGWNLAQTPGGRMTSKPDFDRGAEVARMLLTLDVELGHDDRIVIATALYNEACNLAIDGEPDRALDALENAIDNGFSDPVIFEDLELDPLRGLERFRDLLRRIPEPK